MTKKQTLAVPPTGSAFRVLTARLTWPADRAVVERLLAGEDVPHDARGVIREAHAGDIVTDLVPESVPSLLGQGWIEPVDPRDEIAPVAVDGD